MIRLIKAKERRRAGNIYCTYCRPEKVKAFWRFGWRFFACEEHKHIIERYDSDDRITLADEMTWKKL